MTFRYRREVVMLLSFFLVVAPSIASAAGLVAIVPCGAGGSGANTNPCTLCDLAQLAQNVLNDAIYLAVVLSAVLFAWAGFLYLTNVANSGQHSRAIEVFKNVFVGLLIILAAWLVIDTLMRTFLGASVLPWNVLC